MHWIWHVWQTAKVWMTNRKQTAKVWMTNRKQNSFFVCRGIFMCRKMLSELTQFAQDAVTFMMCKALIYKFCYELNYLKWIFFSVFQTSVHYIPFLENLYRDLATGRKYAACGWGTYMYYIMYMNISTNLELGRLQRKLQICHFKCHFSESKHNNTRFFVDNCYSDRPTLVSDQSSAESVMEDWLFYVFVCQLLWTWCMVTSLCGVLLKFSLVSVDSEDIKRLGSVLNTLSNEKAKVQKVFKQINLDLNQRKHWRLHISENNWFFCSPASSRVIFFTKLYVQ